MSRVSKELEALNEIFEGVSNSIGYIKEFRIIQKALTPPTAEEVCKVIQDHLTLKNKVIYDEKDNSFGLEYGNPPIYSIPLIEVKEGYITHCLPFTTPKMLILIGRFYA